ncbi:hypothetical protein P4O66_017561, partial [Electrophorus voltai]
KQAFRTETRYILFAHTLLVDLIFLLLTDFVVLISYSDVLMPMVFCIPFCILMEMVTLCTPLTITAMCVERYVAISGVVSVAACSKHGTATTFAQEGAVAPCSQDGTTTLCYLVGAVMPCPLSQMLQLAPCVPMVSPWNGMENICPPPRFVSKSTSPIPYPQESAVAVSSLKENIASMKVMPPLHPAPQSTLLRVSVSAPPLPHHSNNYNLSSGEKFNCSEEGFSVPKKIKQVPGLSPKEDAAMGSGHHQYSTCSGMTECRKQAFRTETRYILFAYTLLVDLIFLLLTDFVVLISYSDVQIPMVFCIPVCMLMEMVTICTPMIITAMCVERYVAICMPLRHSALSTSSKTHTAILIIWT